MPLFRAGPSIADIPIAQGRSAKKAWRAFRPSAMMVSPIKARRTAVDAVTPKEAKSLPHDTLDTHSHVVRPAEMEWKKTRFAGCEVKGLLIDKETGVVTALMRFAPGAILPDHEHVKIEQTFVLEGRLVDKEGPAEGLSVGPGEFVWREAGSRHVAWTPEGGLMLAMFQVPNKFFEKDGRVTDLSGTDWDALWGHVFKD
jgi:anti-sigma factor ChrR (cupin superfamily)